MNSGIYEGTSTGKIIVFLSIIDFSEIFLTFITLSSPVNISILFLYFGILFFLFLFQKKYYKAINNWQIHFETY